MKTLFLLRHAKSSWSQPGLSDHERPLDTRGQRAATLMGSYLAQRGARPAMILCSSARRARETLDRVLPQLDPAPLVHVEEEIYLASPGKLLARLAGVDPGVRDLLVIGHNPGLQDLAEGLAGSGDAQLLRRLRQKFPTAALAALRFEVAGWNELGPGDGLLCDFATPKDLV